VCVCVAENVCFHLHLHTWPAINYIFFLRSSAGSKQAARTHACIAVREGVRVCECVCVPFDWSGGL